MREVLERRLLPYVMRPGRYVGGELGQITKDHYGRTSYLHAFPDKYEIGQAHIGSQIIYHIVNQDDRFVCERVYAVDRDAEEIMRHERIELFSLETSRPARKFDAVGFTVSFELVYANVIAMLDLAGIPLESKDRDDTHPIIFAGGPAVFNPEPLSDFIDLFFVGDAEEGILELLTIIHENKNRSRREKLEALVRRVPSVYIPAFYSGDRAPLVDFAPSQITARIAPTLKLENYPEQPILPLIDTVHNHLAVEIMRGCPQGCRFCQASPTYKPVRVRPQHEILAQMERQLANTGYAEVSLMSLSTSDYPGIEQLAQTAARRLKNQRVSLSLPSLRPGSITPGLLDAVALVRSTGITLAPEAGTERLRSFIRKDFADEAIFDSARIIFDKGWNNLKLYFMIGLPTETDEDLMGIARIVSEVNAIGQNFPGKKTISVSLSPFTPRPHTPFQWDEMLPAEEIKRRIAFVRKHTRGRQVTFRMSPWESSFVAGIFGRGDRSLGRAVLHAYKSGCRFDGWIEDFDWEMWQASFEAIGFDYASAGKSIPFGANLPWTHIRKGPSVEQLHAERTRTSLALQEFIPKYTADATRQNGDSAGVSFGRAKKKVPSRNLVAPTKNCVRLRWGKTKRCRFMSHLDNIRTLERALRRAKVPVAFSQGFNPTMKLSFGPPLTLGFTSECEFVDITLETNLEPAMIDNLKKAMPEGMQILEARVVFGKPQSLSAGLNRADYSFPVDEISFVTDLDKRIANLLAAQQLRVTRTTKSKIDTVDIRPGIFNVTLEANELRMVLGLDQAHYVRPTEVASVLLDDDRLAAALAFHRREMFRVDDDGARHDGMDV